MDFLQLSPVIFVKIAAKIVDWGPFRCSWRQSKRVQKWDTKASCRPGSVFELVVDLKTWTNCLNYGSARCLNGSHRNSKWFQAMRNMGFTDTEACIQANWSFVMNTWLPSNKSDMNMAFKRMNMQYPWFFKYISSINDKLMIFHSHAWFPVYHTYLKKDDNMTIRTSYAIYPWNITPMPSPQDVLFLKHQALVVGQALHNCDGNMNKAVELLMEKADR